MNRRPQSEVRRALEQVSICEVSVLLLVIFPAILCQEGRHHHDLLWGTVWFGPSSTSSDRFQQTPSAPEWGRCREEIGWTQLVEFSMIETLDRNGE